MLIGVDVGGTNIRALLIDDSDVRVVARTSASTPHDADELAAETDLSPKRVGRWIDRAGDR